MQRLAILLTLASCGTSGALRQTKLAGHCAEGDAACARRAPLAPLAIGARFHPAIATEIAGTTTPNLVLDSAAPAVLAVEDGALVGKSQGASAVLIATDDGTVVDFVHVWVAPITKLTLARRDGDLIDGTIGLAVGEDLTIQPALWNGAQRLTGDAAIEWKASPADVVAILRDGSPDRRRLRARSPGKATITVGYQNHSTTLAVEVVP